jgi:hypothetical protein
LQGEQFFALGRLLTLDSLFENIKSSLNSGLLINTVKCMNEKNALTKKTIWLHFGPFLQTHMVTLNPMFLPL